ncbi:hypothetical protein CB1_000692003 [Camelus ferus]|nr:hypothetical protein CB1_000692003 [Camelus ferus]
MQVWSVTPSWVKTAVSPRLSLRSEPPPGKRECRVGQYVVDLASFEQLALPVLRNAGSSSGPGPSVCVIDEVGKMELFSQPFIQAVRRTLSTPGTIVLGTIPIPKGRPLALVEEIRTRKDVKVFSVSTARPGNCRVGAGGSRQTFGFELPLVFLSVLEYGRQGLTNIESPGSWCSWSEHISSQGDGQVTKENRNHLLPEIVACVQSGGK